MSPLFINIYSKKSTYIVWSFSLTILLFSLLFPSCSSNVPEYLEKEYASLPNEIDFNFHVRPILSDRCFHCHGPDENSRAAGLRLDDPDLIFCQIPESGAYPVVAGKPDKSEIIKRILSHDPSVVMPTPESNLSLTETEKAILIKWVEQGAQWKDHWAYIPPEKAELPEVKNSDWPKNELDYFVLNTLETKGLQPSPEASKRTLIRRLSLDLIGLPPSPEEINTFINDDSPDAYERAVDRLLSSSHYGERWGWEWMDVARYSDTNGFQNDPTRTMWPWRDWVVEAFNTNMPYDEFTVKQLAGDLLPDATPQDIMATAFSRNNPHNGEGGRIPEETRVENTFDRVETMGTTWLGLTLECSRCHDHKYDAISQREYYQFFDYFNQTTETGAGNNGQLEPVIDMSADADKEITKKLEDYMLALAEETKVYEDKKFPRAKGVPASESEAVKQLNGINHELLKYEPQGRYPEHFTVLAEYFQRTDPTYAGMLRKTKKALDSLNAKKQKNLLVMVMDERDSLRPTYVLERGTYSKPKEKVVRNVPRVLPPIKNLNTNNRLTLAEWLVSRQNPLTSRVTVNRYWQSFFGRGIVKTIEDFGVQGDLPTHPELLDWLAVDFQESGWDLKKLFKTIVMSATYRQSSKVSQELWNQDPENKYLARASRMRLPSWMIRDQALKVSGLLNTNIGGKPVKPYQPEGVWTEATFGTITYDQDHGEDLYRRTLYTFWRRIVAPTMLFDNSTRQKCAVKRMQTNTPLHALATLNDVTYIEASRVLAENVLLSNFTDDDRIVNMFEIATGRKPKPKETAVLREKLDILRNDFCEKSENAATLVALGEYMSNSLTDDVEHAAYTALGSMVLNLDETITRQ